MSEKVALTSYLESNPQTRSLVLKVLLDLQSNIDLALREVGRQMVVPIEVYHAPAPTDFHDFKKSKGPHKMFSLEERTQIAEAYKTGRFGIAGQLARKWKTSENTINSIRKEFNIPSLYHHRHTPVSANLKDYPKDNDLPPHDDTEPVVASPPTHPYSVLFETAVHSTVTGRYRHVIKRFLKRVGYEDPNVVCTSSDTMGLMKMEVRGTLDKPTDEQKMKVQFLAEKVVMCLSATKGDGATLDDEMLRKALVKVEPSMANDYRLKEELDV